MDTEQKNNKKHITAKERKTPSAPMRYLADRGLLSGHTLDYGCGRGFDAEYYKTHRYDPYYFPIPIFDNSYDTITCHYVLNVVDKKEEKEILLNINKLLKESGVAYLTVRRNIEKEGFTSKGTYQRNVILDLPILVSNARFCIYIMKK